MYTLHPAQTVHCPAGPDPQLHSDTQRDIPRLDRGDAIPPSIAIQVVIIIINVIRKVNGKNELVNNKLRQNRMFGSGMLFRDAGTGWRERRGQISLKLSEI